MQNELQSTPDDRPDTRPQQLALRFREAGYARLSELIDAMQCLDPVPPDSGNDRSMTQRQTASRAVVTHIAMLMKLLGIDPAPPRGDADRSGPAPGVIDEARLSEIIGRDITADAGDDDD